MTPVFNRIHIEELNLSHEILKYCRTMSERCVAIFAEWLKKKAPQNEVL
jgi:hypothetical protein